MRLSILLAVCAQLFHAGASNFNLKNSLAAHSEQPQNVVESRDQPSVSPPTIFIRFGNKPIQVGYHARPTPGRDMLDVSLKNKLSDMCKNKKPGFDSCGKAVGRIKNIEHATLGQYGEGGFLVLHVLASYFPAGTAGEALRTTIIEAIATAYWAAAAGSVNKERVENEKGKEVDKFNFGYELIMARVDFRAWLVVGFVFEDMIRPLWVPNPWINPEPDDVETGDWSPNYILPGISEALEKKGIRGQIGEALGIDKDQVSQDVDFYMEKKYDGVTGGADNIELCIWVTCRERLDD